MPGIAVNHDELFNHGKNVFFADFADGQRLYLPWDLDSAIAQRGGIYPSGSPYSDILLGVPEFRDQYTRIVNDLVCRLLQEEVLLKFLDDAEELLTEALATNPNNQVAENARGLREAEVIDEARRSSMDELAQAGPRGRQSARVLSNET